MQSLGAIGMDRIDEVEEAIIRFKGWHYPNDFYEFVNGHLSAEGQARFEEIWNEAIVGNHWNSPSLRECSAQVARTLERKYPHLKRSAIEAVARGACYVMR